LSANIVKHHITITNKKEKGMVLSKLLALSSAVLSVQAMLPSDIPSPFTQKVNFTATYGSYVISAGSSGTEIPLSSVFSLLSLLTAATFHAASPHYIRYE